MSRRAWNAIAVLAASVLLAMLAGAQSGRVAYAELADLLLTDGLTREQLMGLYRSLTLAQFQPPACVAGQEMFTDVPASNPFCPWVEELARRGITSGCGGGNFCPSTTVTRAQMATFIVKAQDEADGCRPRIRGTGPMRKVGSFCIDRYENSVWTQPNGGTRLTTEAEIDAVCPDDGQDCKGKIFARSIAGVEPARSISWFQAQQALANSGKRLPTSAEWQMAASGTPDHPGPCNSDSGSVQNAGASPDCKSDWDAFDMVGNVWEWVADWVSFPSTCPSWGGFSDDQMCLSGASETVQGPGALVRGGYFNSFANAGPFAVDGGHPSSSDGRFGFRGAR